MKISRITPSQLRGECQLGFRALDGLRSQRMIDYSLYKGRHYSARATDLGPRTDRQPVNLHQQLIRTMVPFLAPNAPLSEVTARRIDLQFEAEIRKDIYDFQAEQMRLHEVYQDACIDAVLTGAAFTLNGIKRGGEKFAARATALDMGREFTRLLDLDDISIDPNSKNLTGDKRFIAYRYTVDRQDAIDAVEEGCYGALPEDYQDGILPNPDIATPAEAVEILSGCNQLEQFPKRGDRIDENEGEWYSGTDRLGQTICLWDVVLYIDGQVWIVTLPGDPSMSTPFPGIGPDKFLACYRWEGPASGPINVLSFLRVPFNKMPLALAQMQRDLAEIIDILSNKTFRQLLRTKTLTIYEGSAENMAMAMRRSAEGGYIRGNPNSVKTVQDGGMIPEMMPGTQYFSDQWQNAVGNLAMAAGTGEIGKTATAFEGLMQRVQGFLDFLRSRLEQLATDDLRVRAALLSMNPMFSQRIEKSVGQGAAAVAMSMQATNPSSLAPPIPGVTPYQFQGTPEDFEIRTRAFSMTYSNPLIEAQNIMRALSEVIPAAMQAGLDPRPVLSILSKKLNEPELEQLIPDPVTQAMQQQEQAMAAVLQANPTGGDNGYADAGPAGRRVPQGQRNRGQPRAMNPGPGTGSPRPMTMQMTGAAA